MAIVVDSTPAGMDFGATGWAEITQNVKTILTTMIGTVPLDRAFGIDISPLDSPTAVTRAQMTPIIIEAVETFEPRVVVDEVRYLEDEQGTLLPSVTLSLAEGVIL